ncbi:lysozyme inhibitor LprI family protein [Zobellia uliginosa]|uniref:lysozyme inhibitor LprI family protein n=1 Tax=Zobellia uliginosa TaxID=143224 RepID=UPI0026E26F31|nr:lysozyme inhibitor LprI family protein [Zobellia uliginosa]MDO6518564.1 lysozyme inhibitor LprI family protein [Zobellia uliginosa]
MAKRIDCENPIGTNMESRICLNLKFQNVDSILNHRLVTYLDQVENDSLKSKIKAYQENWILNRRLQSDIFSEGYSSNTLGIYYLRSMVNSTELRIKELELLIEN